jgi:hypothetical protein
MKKILLLAMANLTMFAACTVETYSEVHNTTNTYLYLHTEYVSAAADTVSIVVPINGEWTISIDKELDTWCSIINPSVENARKDSLTVTVDVAQNETGKIRAGKFVVSSKTSTTIGSDTIVDVIRTRITIIQDFDRLPLEGESCNMNINVHQSE